MAGQAFVAWQGCVKDTRFGCPLHAGRADAEVVDRTLEHKNWPFSCAGANPAPLQPHGESLCARKDEGYDEDENEDDDNEGLDASPRG